MAAAKTYLSICVLSALLCAGGPGLIGAGEIRGRVDLNGSWEFQLDAANEGLAHKWFQTEQPFAHSISVPGAWQAQGFGKPEGNLRHQYAGAAWYRRKIAIPPSWRGRRVTLVIGGAHRRTTAFVNGMEAGKHDGFSAPFSFDVTEAVQPGAENTVVLRIENPQVTIEESPDKQEPALPTGMLNYIANWGGIYGNVALESEPQTRIDSLLVLPNIQRRAVSFRVKVVSQGASGPASIRITTPGAEPVTREISPAKDGAEATLTVALPHAPLWTPDDPHLLTAEVQLLENGRVIDRVRQRFGMREISARGNALLLNGKPIYLRGYGDDNIEVLSGFPPSSRGEWIRRLQLAKSFGFNAVRFHSMVPPEEFFFAADEVGMLVMAELPAAYTQYFFAHQAFLKRELVDVLTAYRNHPSLLSLAFGNEFNLKWLKSDTDRTAFLAAVGHFYEAAKEIAPATLILSNDGFDMRPTDMVSLFGNPPDDRPTVRHEFGQYYCSLPDIGLIDRFTGVMIPEWLEAKKKWVNASGLGESYPRYLRNSWKLQQLGRKYQIERARADGRVTGYHYWLLVDFPGGTGEGDSWEEGWFDYFWEPKGVTPAEGREINSPVLLMIDAGVDARTLRAGEPKKVSVRLSNYGASVIRGGGFSWKLLDGNTSVAGGSSKIDAELGTVSKIAELSLRTAPLSAAKKLQLVLRLETPSGAFENRWDFWAFPEPATPRPAVPVAAAAGVAQLRESHPWISAAGGSLPPDGLLITDSLSADARAHLRAGGRVWLMLRATEQRRGVPFFPADGGAFGTLVRDHPALSGMPHADYCDLQFYNLINGAYPLPIDGWPKETEPMIGGIRTTSEFLSKMKNLSRIAFAVEGNAGGGKLLITTLRLTDKPEHPEARAMLDSLLRYAAGGAFNPRVDIPESALTQFETD
jgi:hypothetical protein